MRFSKKDLLNIVKEDEEKYVILINQAKEEEQAALEELFHRYRPLIRRIWQQYYVPGYELADWEQEARIIMTEVLRKDDQQNPRMFSGFLKRCLQNKIMDICRQATAHKRIPASQISSLDASCIETIIDPIYGAPDDIVYCHQSVNRLLQQCSAFERRVLSYLHSGYTLPETATALGCSKRSVQSAVHRCRNKLLHVLQNES